MNLTKGIGLGKPRPRSLFRVLLMIAGSSLILGSCSSSSACEGSGGSILLSPVCKSGFSNAECQEWDLVGVDDADWIFHGGKSCESLGYTNRCSEGTYRLPGKC